MSLVAYYWNCIGQLNHFFPLGVVNSPTYWVGTNSGSVLIFSLVLPLPENRREEEIHASLSKEIQLRHHAPVVHIAVIDSQGSPVNEKVPTKDSSTDGSQKVVICSEEQFKVRLQCTSLSTHVSHREIRLCVASSGVV